MDVKRIRSAVETACARMGVSLAISPRPQDGIGWLFAPVDSAALYVAGDDRRVWLNEATARHPGGWIYALHELEHCVFWHPENGVDIDEMLMMPWAVAVLRSAGLPSTAYMRSSYTLTTQIGVVGPIRHTYGGSEVGDWKRPERSAWFLSAKRDNIAAGTITPGGLPTWKFPDWDALGRWSSR